jgi:hypothetical protein
MKHKLVLIFDEDSEVVGLNKAYIFNNELDAETFLCEVGQLFKLVMNPDGGHFSFKTGGWNGSGKAYWVEDKS